MHCKIAVRIALLFFLTYAASAQQKNGWSQYTRHYRISGVAVDGTTCWIGTDGTGLVKLDIDKNSFTYYNNNTSPLPSNFVKAVVTDTNKGVVWIGMDNELASFDGKTWRVFNYLNSPLVDFRRGVFDIDDSSRVWISTGNGIIRWDGFEWVNICDKYPGFPLSMATGASKLRCAGSTVWIQAEDVVVSFSNGVWEEHSNSLTMFVESSDFAVSSSDFAVSRDGTLWFRSDRNKSLLGIGNEPTKSFPSPSCSSIKSGTLLVDYFDRKWFINSNSICISDSVGWVKSVSVPYSYFSGSAPYYLNTDNSGRLWCTSDNYGNEIFCFDPARESWTSYKFENLKNDLLSQMYYLSLDPKGTLWGEYLDTLYSFSGNNVVSIPKPGVEQNIQMIAIDKRGRLSVLGSNGLNGTMFCATRNAENHVSPWTINEHAIRMDRILGIHFGIGSESWIISYLIKDWMSLDYEILAMNTSQKKIPSPKSGDIEINYLAETEKATLWAGDGSSLFVLRGSAWEKVIIRKDQTDTIPVMIPGASDSLWVAIKRVGLGLFDGTRWSVFDSSVTGFSKLIPMFYCKPRRELWCAAYRKARYYFEGRFWSDEIPAGLYRFNGNSGELFTTANSGLHSNEIYTVVANEKEVWVKGKGGLSRWNYDSSTPVHFPGRQRAAGTSYKEQTRRMNLAGKSSFTVALKQSGNAIITLYDLSGRLLHTIHNGYLERGEHLIAFSGFSASVAKGMFLVKVNLE